MSVLTTAGSWAGIVLMLPLALRAARTFRPPLLPWPAVPLAHLPAAMLFAAGQLAIMLAIRKVIQSDVIEGGMLIAEVRRDIVVYALVVTAWLMVRAIAERREP